MLSNHPVKCAVHRPCESGDIMFLICNVTMWLIYHVTLWVGSPYPKLSPC